MRKEYILFYKLLLRRPAALNASTDICLSHVFEIASSNFHVYASSIVLCFFFRRLMNLSPHILEISNAMRTAIKARNEV
mgnify:CR=1 FL=1